MEPGLDFGPKVSTISITSVVLLVPTGKYQDRVSICDIGKKSSPDGSRLSLDRNWRLAQLVNREFFLQG